MKFLLELIATGLFSGKLPKMPGTWGSILAAVLCYLFWPHELVYQIFIILITFVLSVVSSDFLSKELKSKDPDVVVIDEILGIELTFLGLSVQGDIKLAFLGLVLFRVIDIMKPPPIPWFEKLPGGWGITVDDAIAGLVSNLLLRLIGGLIHV
ncbi:MAG: phosphatidylglycerophosphatase A [Thermovibrio sp.]|nr:MAG: phosphatidylglycerophosphatase A [Thermovibrio sp.]